MGNNNKTLYLSSYPYKSGEVGGWKNVPEQIKGLTGFIYVITNKKSGRMYIGQKRFWKKIKLPPLKGRKNKRHRVVESDWQDYYGSCKELLGDIERQGKEDFLRVIVRHCKSFSEMHYYEAKMQFDCEVMFREDYYNNMINLRISKVKTR